MAANQHGWYSADEKAQYVQGYLSSNLSLKEYSEANNLSKSTLATWVRHYNSANEIASTSFQNITPVLKQDIDIPSSNIKLTLPNGISIEFDSSILHQVIEEFK